MSIIKHTSNLLLTLFETDAQLPTYLMYYTSDMSKIDNGWKNHELRLVQIEDVISTVSTANITDLQSRMSALENKVTANAEQIHEINDNISTIIVRLNNHDNAIVDINNRISALDGRVGSLETCCVTVQDNLNALDIRVSKNTGDIRDIIVRMDRAEANILGNSEDIRILSAQVSTNAHNIDELTHALDDLDPASQLEIVRQVAQNTADIDSLKTITQSHTTVLDGYAVRFTNDELRITALENRMTDIENAIEQISDWQDTIDALSADVSQLRDVDFPALQQFVDDNCLKMFAVDSSQWVDVDTDLIVENDGKAVTAKVARVFKNNFDTFMLVYGAFVNNTNTALDAGGARITATENRLDALDDSTSGRVTSLESRCTTIEGAISDLGDIVGDGNIAVGDDLTDAVNVINAKYSSLNTFVNSIRDLIGWDSVGHVFETLDTTAQTIIGAVNELVGNNSSIGNDITALFTAVGDLSTLQTTIKSNLVDAINEVFNKPSVPIGVINPYGGNVAPTGWLMCDGSAVSRDTYADLFSIIGTAYGGGDGSTTFNLPDMRESVPKGAGLSGYNVGTHLDADGLAVGEFLDDRLQEHAHYEYNTGSSGSAVYGRIYSDHGAISDWGGAEKSIMNARKGATTEVKSVGVNYIIKY